MADIKCNIQAMNTKHNPEGLTPEQFQKKTAHIRTLVTGRLSNNGWITGADIQEPKLGQLQYKLILTENGTAKMRALHAILGELGYFPGPKYTTGELDFLAQMIGAYGKP